MHTESDKAKQAHRTTLEFLLVNHPIDCPVCDQAGECYLQDQYMTLGLHDSKVEPEEKVQKRKVVDLGPIMLDAERCVLCSRCLRFEEHVTGTNSFEFRNRGDHTQIATFEDRPITHNYAWNLADVCPVGALLSHDFRFKMRVWFLESTDSVCPGCSTGCNIHVDQRDRRSTACGRGATSRSTSPGCATSGASSTRRSRWTRACPPRACAAASALGGDVGRHRPGPRGREDPGRAPRLRVPGHAPGHERGRLRVQAPVRARGRPSRLPRRQPAGQDAGPRGQRAAARRPQSQHHGLPRPGPRRVRASTRSSRRAPPAR